VYRTTKITEITTLRYPYCFPLLLIPLPP